MSRASTLPELRERYGARYRWLLLLAVMTGSVAAIMSSTIINVAVPDLSAHFTIGQERAQWVASGFMMAMTVSMLTTPWLLGRFGYRRTYAGTMWLLLLGGVAGGFANNFELVLAARVAEGLAAGVVQPIPAIVIMRAFGSHEQGRAMGIFGTGVVLAPALGPSLGGVLVDWFGWRSIFFMVVPFCLVSLWMSARFVPTSAPGGVTASSGAATMDWPSLLMAGAGTMCLLNALVQLHQGAGATTFTLFAAAVVVIACFIQRQRTLSQAMARGEQGSPLMNQALFADPRFAMGSVVAFIYGMALFGSTYLLPVYLQLGLQLSASFVGGILLPSGLVLAMTIGLTGRMADKVSTHIMVSLGLGLLALSFALILVVTLGTPIWYVVAFTVLGRIGLGFILPSLNLGAMRGLRPDLIAQGASAINFMRMLGGSAGVSLCGIVLEWRLAAHGDDLSTVASSPARLAAFNESFLMLTALCALAMLAAWQLRAPPDAAAQQQSGQ
ncbi:MFS transporter [Comamonadaceae bacterium G21597-S1]|nr:MFS transporter [Comamonadaceae bacterium G21597-S1]